jgi:hypothetical protein
MASPDLFYPPAGIFFSVAKIKASKALVISLSIFRQAIACYIQPYILKFFPAKATKNTRKGCKF